MDHRILFAVFDDLYTGADPAHAFRRGKASRAGHINPNLGINPSGMPGVALLDDEDRNIPSCVENLLRWHLKKRQCVGNALPFIW